MKEDSTDPQDRIPSHAEAQIAFENGIIWLRNQKENNSVQLFLLKQIVELAKKKQILSLVQTRINDYFNRK